MKACIISAPFGNYYNILNRISGPNFTPTLGTYTAAARGFLTKPYGGRLTRIALTLRYSPTFKSWKNKIGLKNPGVGWLQKQVETKKIDVSDKIVSIYGWTMEEWELLVRSMAMIRPLAVEVNASCPNVDKPPFTADLFHMIGRNKLSCIVKIPPVGYHTVTDMAYGAGIRAFHATNTLPTPRGGLSGKALLPVALDVVKDLRRNYRDCTIIGGGGITCLDDAMRFRDLGADHVAVGSMLFNPLSWREARRIMESLANYDLLMDNLK